MEEDESTTPKKKTDSQLNLPPSMNRPTVSLESRINRLIDSNHYHSPSKPIYSDRFIPSRSGSNFALFDLASSSPKKDGKEDGAGSYASLLKTALFGPVTPEKSDVVNGFSPSRNIFRFKTETQRSVNLYPPFGSDVVMSGVSPSPVKSPRKILRSPYKVSVCF